MCPQPQVSSIIYLFICVLPHGDCVHYFYGWSEERSLKNRYGSLLYLSCPPFIPWKFQKSKFAMKWGI
jgi:hypothetical protein